jgi:hypothetical protein
VVRLADSVEVDQFAVEIVQYLNLGRLFVKEHLRTARKWFNIRYVLGKFRDNCIGNAVLSADIGEWTLHVFSV